LVQEFNYFGEVGCENDTADYTKKQAVEKSGWENRLASG